MPIRIQRKRSKGWKLPPNTVCVSRPGIFGNPFTLKGCKAAGFQGTDDELRARCVEAFRAWLISPNWRELWDGEEAEKAREAITTNLSQLTGKDLACWCPTSRSCHADVLLEFANNLLLWVPQIPPTNPSAVKPITAEAIERFYKLRKGQRSVN